MHVASGCCISCAKASAACAFIKHNRGALLQAAWAHHVVGSGANGERQARGFQVVHQVGVLEAADAVIYPLHLQLIDGLPQLICRALLP